jgi:hypothetical protein
MSGIKVFILRNDFDVVIKTLDSSDSHVHYRNGSYLNIDNAILRDDNGMSNLLFQEGNAIPKGASSVIDYILWITWYLPMRRGMSGHPHGRPSFEFLKQIINLKTLPWLIVGLAILVSLLKGGGVF